MMKNKFNLFLNNEEATLQLGTLLSTLILDDTIIYLVGELGTGKTTLVRGFLRGLGYSGAIKSPTFTIVESYAVKNKQIYHFDLYRIQDPEELEWIGIRDYFAESAICWIEWPDNAQGILPNPDVVCQMTFELEGRKIVFEGHTEKGQYLIKQLHAIL